MERERWLSLSLALVETALLLGLLLAILVPALDFMGGKTRVPLCGALSPLAAEDSDAWQRVISTFGTPYQESNGEARCYHQYPSGLGASSGCGPGTCYLL